MEMVYPRSYGLVCAGDDALEVVDASARATVAGSSMCLRGRASIVAWTPQDLRMPTSEQLRIDDTQCSSDDLRVSSPARNSKASNCEVGERADIVPVRGGGPRRG